MEQILFVAGMNEPVIADYATWAARSRSKKVTVLAHPSVCGEIKECVELHSVDNFSTTKFQSEHFQDCLAGLVLFLDQEMNRTDQHLLDTVVSLATEKGVDCICIVSSFRIHFGDSRAIHVEDKVVNRFQALPARIVVFRSAHILSPRSRVTKGIQRYHYLAPVVSSRLRSCFVNGEQLFAAIDMEFEERRPWKRRTYTILLSPA